MIVFPAWLLLVLNSTEFYVFEMSLDRDQFNT